MARVLVIGGARSGKSREAERRLLGADQVTYVAAYAGDPSDGEWAARVAEHRARRPASWRTLETGDVAAVLRDPPTGAVLVDCVTVWLTRAMDDAAGWGEEAVDPVAVARVRSKVDELVAAWADSAGDVVVVTNEVGQGVVPATASGRWFRDEMGALNARLAAAADEVWWLVAGIAQRIK